MDNIKGEEELVTESHFCAEPKLLHSSSLAQSE